MSDDDKVVKVDFRKIEHTPLEKVIIQFEAELQQAVDKAVKDGLHMSYVIFFLEMQTRKVLHKINPGQDDQ